VTFEAMRSISLASRTSSLISALALIHSRDRIGVLTPYVAAFVVHVIA
jgi:hypothetical protein